MTKTIGRTIEIRDEEATHSAVARPPAPKARRLNRRIHVDQFGDLCGNDFHRVLRRVQPVSGPEQGADVPDLFPRGFVHDWDQQIACQKLRELLVRDPPIIDAL
jgi:hypothetical protein